MNKHTPGPWQSAWDAPDEEARPGENGEEWAIRATDGEVVVGTTYYDGLHMFVTPEDARLIASAPDMLEALEVFVAKHHHPGPKENREDYVTTVPTADIYALRTVLLKARGEL